MYKNNIAKLNALYIVFAPIGRIYEVLQATSLSDIIALILILFNIKYLLSYVKFRRREVTLLVTLTFIGFLSYIANMMTFDFALFLHNLYPLAIFMSGLVLSVNIDINVLRKVWVILGLVATFFCLLQTFQIYTKGYFDNFYIPGLKLLRENENILFRVRPYSFFSEPAHLAIYLLPIFYYSILTKRYILACIFALGVLCSGSTTGLLLLSVLYVSSFKISFKNMLTYTVLAFLVIYLINYFSADILLKNLDKLEGSESDNIRLLGALEYVNYFSFGNWLLGTGFNQVDNFLRSHGVVNYVGDTFVTGNYAPSILFVFICYGIIGEFVFLKYLKNLFLESKKNIGFFLVFLGVLCSDQVLYNCNLLYLWVLVLLSNSLSCEYKREC